MKEELIFGDVERNHRSGNETEGEDSDRFPNVVKEIWRRC